MAVQTTTLFIENLCCTDEEQAIRQKLSQSSGIKEIKFNLISRKLIIRHSTPVEEIIHTLKEAGFQPRFHYELREPTTFWQRHNYLIFTTTAGIFLLLGMLLRHADVSERVLIPVYLISIISGGWRIALKGLKAGKHLALDMNVLMTVATIGAGVIGKWEEGAAVMFLFSVAQLLERYSMERTRRTIQSLMDLSPLTARVKRNSSERTVAVEEVAIGERMVIRPGERIPLDGTVIAGESTVNQAPITGESLPIYKKAGDPIYAGSFNERGVLEVEVTRKHEDTTLARIVRLVEEAQASRAPVQQFTEKFARYYTPAVIVVAVMLSILPPLFFEQPFGMWFYRSLVLLVIACPCALVISTPVTIVSGLSNAARHGVLIKGGRFLEEVGRINAIAFDKTGTLTEGKARVTDVIPLNSFSPNRILQLAAAVEAKSEHHLAAAVLEKAYKENLVLDSITYQHFESLTGRGIRATIDGITYFIGSHSLVEENNMCSPQLESILQKLEHDGKTTIILSTEKEPLGIIAIADKVRKNSGNIVRALREGGIKKAIMLTGDSELTAQSIAVRTNIDEFHAGMLPDEKVYRIQELKDRYGSVAMVGDGVNDAPALAASSVGIAMGASGTDIALETADIVLMSDELAKLPYLMRLSKKTLSIIKQNILIALVTKLIFLALGIFGAATLWMAVLADDGATLAVILNGLRTLRIKSAVKESNF
ncbi:MAG: cadmium-translocating P-type ATPase [Ignavibacteriae bacterium]|nr:cadmium-translocating P-type ATPase [Ignavibacteriota bacterium]